MATVVTTGNTSSAITNAFYSGASSTTGTIIVPSPVIQRDYERDRWITKESLENNMVRVAQKNKPRKHRHRPLVNLPLPTVKACWGADSLIDVLQTEFDRWAVDQKQLLFDN